MRVRLRNDQHRGFCEPDRYRAASDGVGSDHCNFLLSLPAPNAADASAGQHYIVIDENVFAHSRQDLADGRLFEQGSAIPYKLVQESGGSPTQQKTVQILQPGDYRGKNSICS